MKLAEHKYLARENEKKRGMFESAFAPFTQKSTLLRADFSEIYLYHPPFNLLHYRAHIVVRTALFGSVVGGRQFGITFEAQ